MFIMEKKRNFKEKGDAAMIQHVSWMVYCLKKVRHEIQSILELLSLTIWSSLECTFLPSEDSEESINTGNNDIQTTCFKID